VPTILDKPLIRDTGLSRSDRQVFVVMLPSSDGGIIAFKEKGKHGKGIEISLNRVMGLAFGDKDKEPEVKAVPEVKKAKKFVTADGEGDLVDLATLEARLMIDGMDIMTPEIKGRLFDIIREVREERREELSMPPIYHGTRAWQKKTKEERGEE